MHTIYQISIRIQHILVNYMFAPRTLRVRVGHEPQVGCAPLTPLMHQVAHSGNSGIRYFRSTILRRPVSILLGILLITLPACSTAESFVKEGINFPSYKQIGILVRPTEGLSAQDARSVATDIVGIELARKGYRVIERALRKEIVKELGINMTGLMEEDPSELGKLKSIKALLIVSFPRYALLRNRQGGTRVNVVGTGVNMGGKDMLFTEVAVSIRVISVKTGEMLYMATADRKLRGSRLRSATRDIIKKCMKDLPAL